MHFKHPDPHVDSCSVDRHEPVDEIEPIVFPSTEVREARVKCVKLLNSAFAHLELAIAKHGAPVEVQTAFWQVSLALGLNNNAGVNMTDRAAMIGVKRATLSQGARSFCTGNDLPPSEYMRPEETVGNYRGSRLQSIEKSRAA